MVQTSHSLRTLHRVVAPYHGLPGKHTALRTVFAAGELTQAKVLVVIDPTGPATTAERVTELIGPIVALRRRVPGAALSAPSSRRRPHHAARAPAGARALRRRARRAARRRVRVLGTFRVALPRAGHLESRGGEVRDRSVAPHRGGGRAVHGRPDLAAGHDGRRRADDAPRGRAAGRAVARSRAFARTSRSG